MAEKKKVLIVEDERAIANALKLKLEKSGFEATVASNGQVAIDTLKKEKFSLILLDIIMPKKDGFGVLEEMKKAGIKTPVIITSNLGQKEDIKRAKSLGAKDFLVKSDVPLKEVVEKIKSLIG